MTTSNSGTARMHSQEQLSTCPLTVPKLLVPCPQPTATQKTNNSRLLLLGELPGVELQLLLLQYVSITPATLSRSTGDARIQTAAEELLLESLVERVVLGSLGDLLGCCCARLVVLVAGCCGCLSLCCLGLLADRLAVVLLVPLTEWSGVDLNDGALHQSLGADELVVGGVVDDIEDTGLAGDGWAKTNSSAGATAGE